MNTPVFIVAEMSANHLGSLERALAIVDAAKEAGADAIKVQTWTPGRMVLDKSIVLDHGPWAGRRLVDLYEEAFLPWEWHHVIFARARKLGLIPFSAAFDRGAVDFLETLDVDRHKVASFELTDLPLIRYMASKGKPMILSTGMASLWEIGEAIDACKEPSGMYRVPVLRLPVTVLHCVSAYPAPLECMNLRHLLARVGPQTIEYGLSDHSLHAEVPVVATALGATMIEKHLTLSRADGGPDAGFSLEPAEFAAMVKSVRIASASLGDVTYKLQPGEDPKLRRSLWVLRDIERGEALRLDDNVVTARPGDGLRPGTNLEGRRAARALKAGKPLIYEDLA